MPAPPKDQVARELAESHFLVEPSLKCVYWIVSENEGENEPIKLLEVNADTVATGSVEVFTFAPTKDVPYATAIAEVTPEEFERLKKNELKLPRGWSLAKAQLFEPKAA